MDNLTRRNVVVLLGPALLGATAAAKAEQEKASQDSVHYQTTANNGQDCDDCYQFLKPNACRMVRGDINPHGWCKLWTKKRA